MNYQKLNKSYINLPVTHTILFFYLGYNITIFSGNFETLFISCDNGIAAANVATGKLSYATQTGEIYWKTPGSASHVFAYGKNTFVWVGEKDFIGFDLGKGMVKGKMKDNDDPQMTADGNYILVRDDGKVTKYAVNK